MNINGKKYNTGLKEDEIRPEHLKPGQSKSFSSDLKWLLQLKGQFIDVSCPACGANSFTKAFEKEELSYVVCSDCQTMYVNPRPTAQILERYYLRSENYKYWQKYIFPASENSRKEKIFRPRVKRVAEICKKYGIKTDMLLEVGAGFGTFCKEVQRAGLFQRIIAVEPTPDLARACRGKGIEVIEQAFKKLTLDLKNISVVVSFEVIEHLFSPREFVASCASLLAPGGLLILTCPNCNGFDITVLKELSDSVDHEHLNYFNTISLPKMISEFEFEILEVLTPGKLDVELVRKKVTSGVFDASRLPFLKKVLIDDWDSLGANFQQFLEDNKLSSHMWVVARKHNI